MSNVVEILLRLKPDWERAYLDYTQEAEGRARLSPQDVTRLLEILLESHLTGETKGMQHLLDEWMSSTEARSIDPVSFEEYQSESLIGTLQTLRAIVLHVTQQQQIGEDLLNLQAAVEAFFGKAVEYVAYTEATENLLLAQRRQKEVQDALERLDESRANFVSIAAHGLKTPLTLVEGYSKMLADQLPAEDEEAQPLLAGIKSGTDRMRELIDDLVDAAMIDNKMLSLYYQPVRLTDFMNKVLAQFEARLSEKNIKLQRDEPEEFEKTIYADRERFEQAVVEVVDNAVKFTPDNGKIQVYGRSLPGFMQISISDSGVGIAAEDQVRIFDRFAVGMEREGSPDETYNSLGSGLGLHLSKGILEAHGGAIWVDSPGYDPDRYPGSTFHLMIPAREEPPDDPWIRLFSTSRS